MQTSHTGSERNAGIDLLRVVLSFCVVIIHILHYGGFRTHADPSSSGFYFLWFIGIAIDCTVNCFAIVSGFVLFEQEIRYTKILHHLLVVLYHGLSITAAFWLFLPDAVSHIHWTQALLPVSSEEFWYFTSYFGAFFLSPVLIHGMRSLPRKQQDRLIVSLILIFSVIPTLTARDPFNLDRGYSVLWLVLMFLIGAYLKKYGSEMRVKKSVLLSVFIGCVLVTCTGVVLSLFDPSLNGMQLVEYTSPTIVLAAIAVVLLFASAPVPAFMAGLARSCVSFTFSIYLLHEHPLIRQHLLLDRFLPALTLPAGLQILTVLASAAGIWLICFALEYIRQLVFRLLRVELLLNRLDNRLNVPAEDPPCL